MHILFLADAVFDDLPGGSQVVARELASRLVLRGHEVTFLVGRQQPDSPPVEHKAGYGRIIRYEGAGQGLTFVRNGELACRKLLSECTVDIVHTHFAYAAVGPLRAIPKNTPKVRTFHGPWDEECFFEEFKTSISVLSQANAVIKRRLRRYVERSNLFASDWVITLSKSFQQIIADEYHLAVDRSTVIPGGANLDRFRPTSDKKTLRAKLGLTDNRRILLTIRRLEPRMGIENLIQAMPQIIASCPDVMLLIGGKGSQMNALRQQIESSKLDDHIQLLGFIPDELLAEYYRCADLFVLPTLALEGFGLVTIEALASGIPVVGTPIGATPEILNRLDARLVAKGARSCDLAASVISFLTESWSEKLTGERLCRYVHDTYTWDKHVSGVERIYNELHEGISAGHRQE